MKINFSPLANLFNNCRTVNQARNTGKEKINNGLAIDTFVKSTENKQIPSAFSLKDKYTPLKAEMTEYVMGTSELSTDRIKEITQKYCPDVNVDDIKNAPVGTNINYSMDAYTYEPVGYGIENGKIKVSEMPKTLYLKFSNSGKKDDEKRIIFLGKILHELTHVLQSKSNDRKSLFEFSQNYCDKTKSVKEAMPTLKSFNPVFNYTELFMLKSLVTAIPSMGEIPKEINNRVDIDTCFMKKYKMNSYSLARNILNTAVKGAMATEPEADKNAILEYSILKSQREAEAYQHTLDFYKEQLGISGKTDFDLRIELYNSIIKAAEALKE